MRMNASSPEVVDDAVEIIQKWLGRDWVEEKVRRRPKSPTGALVRRLLLRGPVHPIIELLSEVENWKKALESGRPPSNPDRYFSLLSAAHTIKAVAELEGGRAFREELRDRYVLARVSRDNIEHFWNHMFEAEFALQWASKDVEVVMAPPGGNPDVLQRSKHGPAVPVECYRLGDRGVHEEFTKQLELRIDRLCRKTNRMLAVSIRCHRDPSAKDVNSVLAAVRDLLDPVESEAVTSWLTCSVVADSYQVCVRSMGSRDEGIRGTSIEDIPFDISAEPVLSLNAAGLVVEQGVIQFNDVWCAGVRLDWRTEQKGRDRILEGLERKAEQLKKSCGGSDPEPMAAAGVIALRVPRQEGRALLELDSAIRATFETRRWPHVAFVALSWAEPEEGAGSKVGVRYFGRTIRPYQVLNPYSALEIPPALDSRSNGFGPAVEAYTEVDPATGGMTARLGEPPEDIERTPGSWPPGAFEELGKLTGEKGHLTFQLTLTPEFWDQTGDLFLAHHRFGANQLRFVRDKFLNLRVLRFGPGGLRDHLCLDLRPWRGSERIHGEVTWKRRVFSAGLLFEPEGTWVWGRNKRW